MSCFFIDLYPDQTVARCEACQGACVTEHFEPDVSTSLTEITLQNVEEHKRNNVIRHFEEAVDLRHRVSGM